MTALAEPAERVHQRSWAFAALLASLAMLGPFAVDMYLPSFPAIGREFGASKIALQQTLSVYMFAFAFMMLWHGALSDALGRRPIVLAGLVVFALGTLGCAIAGNVQSLWLFRALQGLSAGTGMVVGRAIIRDRFRGPEAQRMMSQITLCSASGPRSRRCRRRLAQPAGMAIHILVHWSGPSPCDVVSPRAAGDVAAHRHALHPSALWRTTARC
jgi:hypothetical protein